MEQENKQCEKCGDTLVKCYVADGLKGLLVKNPEGDRLFSNKKNTNINPYVCGSCGFAIWYADEPKKLL
ncbi:hypothetical protein KO561_14495 [Radiobacillus kanasensis]|uniref:hypothetical protein n=1 Tax=Radiobacillus kanasensis TaxID=2844358 RepID=UPI001E492A49|nr:hypothetical protein [Radiobacillus kanasensis]UFT98401.1 hypothetical protein KO561_14495 [Radiobacillus kanasensis]